MGKIKMEAKIVRQDEIATDIYSMVIQAPEIASQAVPGQFIDVYSADGSKLLPRPISLCEIDRAAGTLRIVYRIAGKGTKEFSMLTSDHTITILGPLGNGFTKKDKKAILIGGGIGIPPMLQLAKELTCEKSIVLGFRDEEFLSEEFEPYGTVYKSSDNGRNRCQRNGYGCNSPVRHRGHRDLCLRTNTDASCDSELCTGTWHRSTVILRRAYGMRCGCLPCLRMQVEGD